MNFPSVASTTPAAVVHGQLAPRIAVLIPCFNEEAAVADVVHGAQAALPLARIYVVDNGSSDHTMTVAHDAGATVVTENMRGKGNAVRRAFAEIDADVYVMIDGDNTYDIGFAPMMIDRLLSRHLDMVVGLRKPSDTACYRPGHRFGNWLFSAVIQSLFKGRLQDVFSGYRVFSRRFIKSFPAVSSGFEIEAELTVHALELRLPIEEVSTRYFERTVGSKSKLNTFRDGFRILWTVVLLTKQYRPFFLYGLFSLLLTAISLALGIPIVTQFLETGLVPRLPTALLATGVMLLAGMSFMTGLVLHSISRNAIEMKRIFYLSMSSN